MHKVYPNLGTFVNESEVVNLWAISGLQVSYVAYAVFLKILNAFPRSSSQEFSPRKAGFGAILKWMHLTMLEGCYSQHRVMGCLLQAVHAFLIEPP